MKKVFINYINTYAKLILKQTMSHVSYSCPICYGGDRPDPREGYTVCYDCQKTGICDTPFGDKVKFYNTHISGGIGAKVVRPVPDHIIRTTGTEHVSRSLIRETESGEEDYDSRICFIKGIRCYATEARFGGIVISKCQDQTGALSEDELREHGWYHQDPNERVSTSRSTTKYTPYKPHKSSAPQPSASHASARSPAVVRYEELAQLKKQAELLQTRIQQLETSHGTETPS